VKNIDKSALGELVERLPAAVYCSTPEGKFAAGNQALAELFGFDDPESLYDIEVVSLYANPADRELMMERVARGEVLEPEAVELRRRDGSTFWARITSAAIRDENGKIATYEGVIEDITEERSAEERLRRTNVLLDALSEVQSGFIAGEDVSATFERLLEALLELSESEYGFIGEVLLDADGDPYLRTHAITDIAWNAETRAFYDDYAPNNMEFRNLKTLFGAVMTSGKPVYANDPGTDPRRGGLPAGHPPLKAFLGVPLFKGSDMVGMAGMANRAGGYGSELVEFLEPFFATCASLIQATRNDAARLAAERQALVRQQRLAGIVNLAVEGIVVFDQDGTIDSFNPAAQRMFGYGPAEVIGRPVTILIPGDRRREYLAKYRTMEEAATVEMVGLRRDGTTFPMEVSLSWSGGEGGEALTAVIRNVTDRKEAEAALRAAKSAAEKASRAKDEFLAGMSHELRTPLNGVIGLASILARGTHGQLAGKHQEYVEQIEASGRHLLELINDVLDLAKIQANRLELAVSPTSMSELIASAVDLVRESALGQGLTVEVDIDPQLPDLLNLDRLRIKQVLLNLLSNAIKFTPSGGKVGVQAVPQGDAVMVTVWDTGIGIPRAEQHKLFQPFEQVDASLSRERGGTGLGLALSRRLVEAHGGHISVASTPGEGSRFTITVPVSTASAAPRGNDVVAATPIRRAATVLVVEDNEVNRRVVTDYLESSGYQVAYAADGQAAIDQAVAVQPDVILMDIQLPVMDGLAATRAIKAHPELEDVPVVALTALAMKGDAESCLEAGCDSYLAKPVDPDDVLRAIEEQLASSAEPVPSP
jgi:PAS domain S-box-containing protein